jgi:phosphoglycolate phosphatase-like HAD superfamily hydrolase
MTAEVGPFWVWVFDVDATLLDGMSGQSVRPRANELLELLSQRGVRLIAWSAGGADYAERKLVGAGLGNWFAEFREKGDRVNSFYETNFADAWGVFVDDQPGDLSPLAKVHTVRPYLAPNPHDNGLDFLFELVPPRT